MNSSPRIKLFIMMVLELFIWGTWLPLIWTYMGKEGLNFSGGEQSWVGSAFAIASIVAIFFSNQFADRNFSAERFMAFSHLVGGLAILGMFFTKSFWPFFLLMLIHSLFYVPTLSVTNSIAFANLKDPQREYGLVRMGGTVGWILASWPLYFILQGKTGEAVQTGYSYIFVVAGLASLVLAAFSLTLPHTPARPATSAENRFAWLESAKLLAIPYLLVLYLVTFIDSTINNGYFALTGNFLIKNGFKPEYVMPVMSVGQIMEIPSMAVLGWFLKRYGWKTTMILGIFGHAARFAVFAFFPQDHVTIIAIQLLHGICYAFFFAAVYIFIDAVFPKDVRSSAQGLFNLLILGIGDFAAKQIFLRLQGHIDDRTLFLIPSGMALVAIVIMALFFHPPKTGNGEVAAEAEGAAVPATT